MVVPSGLLFSFRGGLARSKVQDHQQHYSQGQYLTSRMWDKEATGVCLRSGRYVSRPRCWGSLTVVFVLAAGGRLSCGAAVRDKTTVWRTRPMAFTTEGSQCAMCETENRFEGSTSSGRYTALDKIRGDEGLPWKCGIEIDFLLGFGSKILGVEFDIFLAGGTQESLQISRVGGSVTLDYKLRKR